MMKFLAGKHFVIQLLLIFLLFTLGAVIAFGLPATLLFQRQTQSQLNRLIDQATRTTLALFENKSTQLQLSARLLSERPTLNQLLFEMRDLEALDEYLIDFLDNSTLDAIAICSDGSTVVLVSKEDTPVFCLGQSSGPLFVFEGKGWMVSGDSLPEGDDAETRIVVGQLVASILWEFRDQSGMDYVLLDQNEVLLASTLMKLDVSPDELLSKAEPSQTVSERLNIDDTLTYQATIVPLPNIEGFQLIGLLNIEESIALNRQLRHLLVITLVGISLLGTGAAVLISNRVSKPLSQLARSAASLREGDLSTPMASSSKIWEVDQLTNALEDARVGLKHALDQLRKDKLWIENLLDSIVEGLLTVDENNRITYASKAVEQLLGIDAVHILGYPLDNFFITPQGEDLFSRQLPTQTQSQKISITQNGDEILLNVSTSTLVPADAGNATRAIVIRDVTDEARIHKLIGEFMANITHEFRTPLSALSASVELLVDELPELTTQEIGQLLSALNIGIIDLQFLIDNLIEAASIEAGRFKVTPQKVELSEIIQSAVETVRPIILKHGLTLKQSQAVPHFLVLADKRRTSQALINLLSNAIKHSPEGGSIRINTFLTGGEVIVEVQDEGQGVAPGRQSQLFHRFITPEEGDNISNLSLGLGLSVVKAVIEGQGGRVGYKAGEPGGAIFWFSLPLGSEGD
jgi:PAS domain S-box-containing protein